MLDAAKVDTDYQLITRALTKVKNPRVLPSTHPGRELSDVGQQLSICCTW